MGSLGNHTLPGAGQVWNTQVGGVPVDKLALMPLDQSIHAAQKTHRGVLYNMFSSHKPCRQTPDGWMNGMMESWEALPMKKVRAAIDRQKDIHLAVLGSNGKETVYDTD